MELSEQRSAVLVVGEALVDVIPTQAGSVARVPGGSPANVALGLSRLGVATSLLTYLADDADGNLVAEHLRASKVHVLPESFAAEHTSIAEARMSSDGDAQYIFDISWDLPDTSRLAVPDLVHFGSIAAFLEPGADEVASLIQRASDAASKVSFDPNIRAAVIPARRLVQERVEWIVQRAAFVKLSDEDARWLYPDLPLQSVASRLRELGAELVYITRGAAGVHVETTEGAVQVPGVPTTVADTVGAGDSFMAAALSQLASGFDPGRAVPIAQYAVRAAAITVNRRGANLPYSHELAD